MPRSGGENPLCGGGECRRREALSRGVWGHGPPDLFLFLSKWWILAASGEVFDQILMVYS